MRSSPPSVHDDVVVVVEKSGIQITGAVEPLYVRRASEEVRLSGKVIEISSECHHYRTVEVLPY